LSDRLKRRHSSRLAGAARILWAGLLTVGVSTALSAGGQSRAVAAAPTACETLTSLSPPNATVTSAKTVAAGAFVPNPNGQGGARRGGGPPANQFADLPPFCRVEGTVARPGDTDVKFEVWMPTTGWNGDFQPASSGFAGGTIGYPQMARILKTGAATVNTNRGHDGGGPWKPADMAALPYHLSVATAKTIVAAHYELSIPGVIRMLLKRFIATPMKRHQFLAGIMISRFIFMVPEIIILLLFSWIAFGVRISWMNLSASFPDILHAPGSQT